MLRVVSQVIRLQARESCVCSDNSKIFSFASALAASSTNQTPFGWLYLRNYQTSPWTEPHQQDGRDITDQVEEARKLLPNRKLMDLNWSPHGLSLVPKLALLSTTTTGIRDTEDDDDDSSDEGTLQAITTKTWKKLKMRKHKIKKRRKAERNKK